MMKFKSYDIPNELSLKQLLQKYASDINDNNFTGIYNELYDRVVFENYTIGSLTELFYSCKIDPLLYLENVPGEFLAHSDNIIEAIIPENIKIIEDSAFYACENLKKITLGSHVFKIDAWALADCTNLEEVIILGDLKDLNSLGIYNNRNLKIIKCNEKSAELIQQKMSKSDLLNVQIIIV